MAKRDGEVGELEKPATADGVRPKLVVTLGRGRTGKSTFIRWAAERAFRGGRPTVVADADRTNATLSAFFDGVSRPELADDDTVKEWLNAALEQQIAERFSMFVDLGGGDLVLKEHAHALSLVEFVGGYGIDPVAVHFLGGSLDDLAYLRDIEETGAFAPERTVLVLNEGILPPGKAPAKAFEPVIGHEVFRAAVKRGAKPVVMPRLGCMAEVDRRRLLFEDAASGRVKPGQEAVGPVNRQVLRLWLRGMDAAFAEVVPWLP